MDPITGTLAIVGLGMQLFGGAGGLMSGMDAAGYASQESQVSQGITKLQQQENDQRQLAMQISARRQQTEIMRKTRIAIATGQAAAVNQGADVSSGASGGQAGISGEGNYNLQGVNQNLEIGNTLFGLQDRISQQQIVMSRLQSLQGTAQGEQAMFGGISSIGGSLAGSAGPLGNILGNFFGNSGDPSLSSQAQGSGMGYLRNQ